jgi:cell wall-associated NlpC family hydrolase
MQRLSYTIAIGLFLIFFASCAMRPRIEFAHSREENKRFRPSEEAEESVNQTTALDQLTFENFRDAIQKFWHAPYVWGGSSPSGTDCSGLISSLYRRATNITLPHSTNQLSNMGVSVKRLQFADLVFFSTGRIRKPSHVGLYIDNDFFLHASVSEGVTLSKLADSPWRENFLGARRILK